MEPWHIDVLNCLRNGRPKQATDILAGPSVAAYTGPPHHLDAAQIERYLNGLRRLTVPIVRRSGPRWRRTGGRFDEFLAEKIYDRNNALQVQNQIQGLMTNLRTQFRATSGLGQPGPFNIARSVVDIPLAPGIMRQFLTWYDLPTTGTSVELAFEKTDIPARIWSAPSGDQWDFLQGIADVCGTLEGRTFRGTDARVKFDLRTNIQNMSAYRSTVEKVCKFCHFIQFRLHIPIEATNISRSNNPRPHKPKIWIGDFRHAGYNLRQRPLWRIKTHYQQRLLQALGSYTAPPSSLCPDANDIQDIMNYVNRQRPTYPSICLDVNHCQYLQNQLNRVQVLPGTSFIAALTQRLARDLRHQGAVMP